MSARTCAACRKNQRGELRRCSCGGRAFYRVTDPRRQSIALAAQSWRPEEPEPGPFDHLPPAHVRPRPTITGAPGRVGRGGAGPQ